MRIMLLAAFVTAIPTAASAQSLNSAKGEIGYPAGALGYDALMAGDLNKAEAQLSASAAEPNDPAVLINLGQIYAKKGDTQRATLYFKAAIAAEPEDLVLASGDTMDSRQAAKIALQRLSTGASR